MKKITFCIAIALLASCHKPKNIKPIEKDPYKNIEWIDKDDTTVRLFITDSQFVWTLPAVWGNNTIFSYYRIGHSSINDTFFTIINGKKEYNNHVNLSIKKDTMFYSAFFKFTFFKR